MHPTDDDTGASMEMPRYQSHKKVWALKIAHIDGNFLTFAEPGYAGISVDPKMFARYAPVPGDYYVQYDDGYKSISPAKAFEEGYTPLTSLRLEAAKQSYKDQAVSRMKDAAAEERKNKIVE